MITKIKKYIAQVLRKWADKLDPQKTTKKSITNKTKG